MRPELFRVFDVGVPAYFFLLVAGFAFATAVSALGAKRVGEDPDSMVDLGLAMLLWGIAGARVLHVLADGYFWDYVHLCTDPSKVDWPTVSMAECTTDTYRGVWDAARGVCHPSERDCLAWAKFWAGGLTYYGGFIGACFGAYRLLRRDGVPFWKAADIAGPTVALGLTFGRLGCFLAGCCFGAPSSLPWAISFPPRSPASEAQFKAHLLTSPSSWSLPVHPTQLYESLAAWAIVAYCVAFAYRRKRYDGQVFVTFLSLYALARFAVEIWRRDDRGGLLGMSTSQWISVAALAAAAFIHVRRRPRNESVPAMAL